jgi:hypothetical protein
MYLDDLAKKHLSEMLDDSQFSFEGMSSRWDDLRPSRRFNVKLSEDFHLGFVFGKIEDNFNSWFYSKNGRSLTDEEYNQFWLVCKKHVRKMHEKYDVFYFQE